MRFWIILPSWADYDADNRAPFFWRIVDEEAGGTVAYCTSAESAERLVSTLNAVEPTGVGPDV